MTKSTAVSTQTRQQQVIALFDERQQDLRTMLAPGVDPERFVRTFKNALIRDPKIAEADKTSIFLECQKAATDGLVLDGREAVLTRFNKRIKNADGTWGWQVEVVYIPMVTGIMKRARNTGQIASWNVSLVHEAEIEQGRFKYFAGDNPRIEHEPMIVGDRGAVAAAYSSVRLTDGTYHHEIMTIDEINSIMARTKSKDKDGNVTGPWATDWAEMAKKTVIRRHSKRLPMSGTDFSVAERVDALYDFERGEDDVYRDPVSPSAKNKRRTSASAKLKQAAPVEQTEPETVQEPEPDAVTDYDPETGEVMDAQQEGDEF